MSECFAIAADAQALTIEQVKAAGANPGDYPRTLATCTRYERGLRDAFSCKLQAGNGDEIATTCREFYAVSENGRWLEVKPRDALRLGFAGTDVRLVEAERADALVQRGSAMSGQPAPQPLPGVATTDTSVPPSAATGLAADATASTAAAAVTAPAPRPEQSPWKTGRNYVWWPEGTCTAKTGETCLSLAQYRAACAAATTGKGILAIDWSPRARACWATRPAKTADRSSKSARTRLSLITGFAVRDGALRPSRLCAACGS